jgi:hypothetical protein
VSPVKYELGFFISQKTPCFIVTAVNASNLAYGRLDLRLKMNIMGIIIENE